MQKFLEKILASIAAGIIRKYRPTIIAVTGSAGKTSTKSAIAGVLGEQYSVRESLKNYNNDLGLPLSVIGGRAAGKNAFGWIGVILKGWSYLIYPRAYANYLVLEMGADRPGDLARLVKIAPPRVSVVTSVGTAHIEFFGSEGAIAEEKETIVRALPKDGFAALNADDPRVAAMRAAAPGRVITYGFSASADVRAVKVEPILDPRSLAALGERVTAAGFAEREIEYDLMGVMGKGHVLASLAALAVAKISRVPADAAVRGLKKYSPPPGRLRLVPGEKKTVIIDDTYNSSPGALHSALEVLRDFRIPERARRIAILGDMKELGGYTERAHREIGKMVAQGNVDYFFAVGEAMHEAVEEAKVAGMSEDRVIHMETAGSAARFFEDKLKSGDVILVKGSQSMRMERAVKELMAEPERAAELLCRQGKEWGN